MKLLSKLKRHQFLFEELVKRDFKKKYKRTVLGMAWSLLSPLCLLLIMRIVFTHLYGRNTEHFTTYLFCGNLVYTFFSDATSQGMGSLLSNAGIYTKVNVPKYLFLFAKQVQCLINFGLTLIVFFLFCIFDKIVFTWKLIFLLYPILYLLVFNVGMCMVLSALYVFFRDMQYLWQIALRALMYLSAIFYSVESFPAQAQKLFYLNPIYLPIRYFRLVVIEHTIPDPFLHLLMVGNAVLALGLGCWMYKKYNTKFLYYV